MSGTSVVLANKRKRNDAIDVAKGIGILLVIAGHTLASTYEFSNVEVIIYSFHMPLFFLISGYCYNQEKYTSFKTFIKARLIHIVCPYLVFCFFSFLLDIVLRCINSGTGTDTIQTIINNFIQIFIAQYSQVMLINVPLWFVTCLLVIQIMYYFIAKLKNRFFIIAIVTVLGILGWYLESGYCPVDTSFLPWNLCSAFFSIGFYAIGNLAKPYFNRFIFEQKTDKNLGKSVIILVVALILAVVCSYIALINGHITIGSRVLNNGVLLYITGVMGTIAVLLISQLIKNSKLLKFFGVNSFNFMACHYIVMNLVIIVSRQIHRIFGFIPYINRRVALDSVILTIADIIVSVIFVLLYNWTVKKINQKRLKAKA